MQCNVTGMCFQMIAQSALYDKMPVWQTCCNCVWCKAAALPHPRLCFTLHIYWFMLVGWFWNLSQLVQSVFKRLPLYICFFFGVFLPGLTVSKESVVSIYCSSRNGSNVTAPKILFMNRLNNQDTLCKCWHFGSVGSSISFFWLSQACCFPLPHALC